MERLLKTKTAALIMARQFKKLKKKIMSKEQKKLEKLKAKEREFWAIVKNKETTKGAKKNCLKAIKDLQNQQAEISE